MTAQSLHAYDNVAGNAYDKYHSPNPIARRLMRGFLEAFDALSEIAAPATAFEIGCGEGHLSARLLARGVDLHGCDLDADIVAAANALGASLGKDGRFTARSIYDIAPGEIAADLVVCCEVLEHLPDPDAALEILAGQHADHWLLSVPREPIWRVLNLARGKYVGALGNTPGHLQHWSARGFQALIERHFEVIAVRRPLPWTMLLCRKRTRRA